MQWGTQVQTDAVEWLLSPDPDNPGVRYFALKDLLDRPAGDLEVQAAQREVMIEGPVPVILAAQDAEGWWAKPGPGYWPKYQSTVWQVIFLSQLGADGSHPQVRTACEYLLKHMQTSEGGLSATGVRSGLIHCLQGNMAAALLDLGLGSGFSCGESAGLVSQEYHRGGHRTLNRTESGGPVPPQREQRARFSV